MASKFLSLNDDILREVCTYLNSRELIALSFVNKRLSHLVLSESSQTWKTLCQMDWLKCEKDSEKSWIEAYKESYMELGEFVTTYKRIFPIWREFVAILDKKCPIMKKTLTKGLKKNDFTWYEKTHEVVLPKSIKLIYTLFNGQHLVGSQYSNEGIMGLFGSGGQFLHNQIFPDLSFACKQMRCIQKKCKSEKPNEIAMNRFEHDISVFPFSYINLYLGQNNGHVSVNVVSCKPNNGPEKEYVTVTPTSKITDPRKHLVIGKSLTDWFLLQMKNVIGGLYPINAHGIINCKNDPNCISKTKNITVTVGWTISWDECSKLFFPYHITMEMDKNAPESDSCQLETRHWTINDLRQKTVSHVNGPGVVGEYPIMKPGSKFSWISCTYFSEAGSMEGHFVMRMLDSGDKFNLICPKFIMARPDCLAVHLERTII